LKDALAPTSAFVAVPSTPPAVPETNTTQTQAFFPQEHSPHNGGRSLATVHVVRLGWF